MIYRFAIAASILAAGCSPPKPGVLVSRDGDQYIVSILNCGDPKWAGLPVRGLRVGKAPPGAVAAAQCVLHLSSEIVEGDFYLSRWRYGSQPKGYALEQCAPLEPGATYEVYVSASPTGPIGHFSVASNGDVTMIDGGCRK
jgi:hypothetical protein